MKYGWIALLILLCSAVACRQPAGAPDARAPTNSAPAAATIPGLGVHLEDSQRGQIKIEELSSDTAEDVIHATGTVEFNADRMARILAPVSGQVQNLRLNVGDGVRAGETLFVLS